MHQEPREKISREVTLPETITIQELAGRMAERAVDVVKYFMKQGQMMKPGDVIDADMAELVAVEFGHTVKRVAESDVEEGLFDIEDAPAAGFNACPRIREEQLRGRAPPARIGRREMLADVAITDRAEQRIGDGMQQGIGVAVPGQVPRVACPPVCFLLLDKGGRAARHTAYSARHTAHGVQRIFFGEPRA